MTSNNGKPTSPLDEYYRGDDGLAAVLGRSQRTIQRWRALGEGPAYSRMGREIIYHRDDVRAWLKSRRIETHGGA